MTILRRVRVRGASVTLKIAGGARGLGAVVALVAAFFGILAVPGGRMAALPQDAGGVAPLPADPPIGGPLWTVLIPAILLIGSFAATYLLYRRFSGGESE